jgi:hypothetical protein
MRPYATSISGLQLLVYDACAASPSPASEASKAAATGATRFTAGEEEEEEEAYGVSQSGVTGEGGGGSRSGGDVVRELVGQAMRATGRVRAQAAEVEERLAQLRAGDSRDRQVQVKY